MRTRLTSVLAVLAGVALLAPMEPARAGLLYDLFGIGQPDPPPAPTVAPVRRSREPGERGNQGRHGGLPKPATTARQAALAEVLKTSGAKAAFVQDPTLKRGDAVVTETGIDVFEGPTSETHDAADFKPVAMSALRERGTLLELDRVSR